MAVKRSASRARVAKGGATPAKRATKKRAASADRRRGMPDILYAGASPHSLGGVSMFDTSAPIEADNVVSFMSDDAITTSAVIRLQSAGFQVLQVSPTTINIAGPPGLYEEVFGCTLFVEDRPVIKGGAREDVAQFIDVRETDLSGLVPTDRSNLADVLEGVAIEEPVYFMAPNAYAPLKAYHHLRVPGDVSLGLNADRAHRGGITGKGIKVVMVDSGWEAHPYFVQRGYRFSPTVLGPSASNPTVDENGHGTAESANLFAVAPDVDFTMVKVNFVNSTGAFNAAVSLAPHIISCSWGSSVRNPPLSAANQALAAAIAAAVAGGVVVVFSAGNGHFGFPGQHPDVISAGGTYVNADGTMRASDYSSGFASNIYAGRSVPDVTGLVGMRPRAAYIMLPLPQRCVIDADLASGGVHPNGDETANNDGWAAISGTSAAAPQLAGACALIKQACPRLGPAAVRDILRSTARDVTSGTSNPSSGGHAATVGPDLATGRGLVDAHRAVLVAKVRCLGPIRQPLTPLASVLPPVVVPLNPSPSTPVASPEPVAGVDMAPGEAEVSGPGLTSEDVAALEALIGGGEDDFAL